MVVKSLYFERKSGASGAKIVHWCKNNPSGAKTVHRSLNAK